MSDTAVFEWKLPSPRGPVRRPEIRSSAKPETAFRILPAIRIPVTPTNRAHLRELRARELELWCDLQTTESARDHAEHLRTRSDREAQTLLILLGIGATALLARSEFLESVWQALRAFVDRVLA